MIAEKFHKKWILRKNQSQNYVHFENFGNFDDFCGLFIRRVTPKGSVILLELVLSLILKTSP